MAIPFLRPLLAVVIGLAPVATTALAAGRAIQAGTPYPVVRDYLEAIGFRPVEAVAARDNTCWDGDPRCDTYGEAASCSYKGPPRCTMLWRRSGGLLEITTAGSSPAGQVVIRSRCRSC
jgi:hypothetical protein